MTTDENGDRNRGVRKHKRVRKVYTLGEITGLGTGDRRILDEMSETLPDEARVLRVMRRDSQGAMTLHDMHGFMLDRTPAWIRDVVERLVAGKQIVQCDATSFGETVYYAPPLCEMNGDPPVAGRGGGSRRGARRGRSKWRGGK